MSRQQKDQMQEQLVHKLREIYASRGNRAGLVAQPTADAFDQGQSELSIDLTVRAINIDWQTARAVGAALERIDDGDYGICEACGADIPASRLRAIPWVALCAPCQSAREQTEDAYRVFEQAA